MFALPTRAVTGPLAHNPPPLLLQILAALGDAEDWVAQVPAQRWDVEMSPLRWWRSVLWVLCTSKILKELSDKIKLPKYCKKKIAIHSRNFIHKCLTWNPVSGLMFCMSDKKKISYCLYKSSHCKTPGACKGHLLSDMGTQSSFWARLCLLFAGFLLASKALSSLYFECHIQNTVIEPASQNKLYL